MKPTEITPQLIDALEEISLMTHLPLEQRLVDTALWYYRNRPRIAQENLPKRLEFAEKSLEIIIEMFALTVQRLQRAEGRPKSSSLWLPAGMEAKGDIRRFG